MILIEKAKQIATEAHKGQKRWGGEPFITHPEAVAEAMKDSSESFIVVAWLHDVIEDCGITPIQLVTRGIPEDIVMTVLALTKIKDEKYLDYILRVKKDGVAAWVKIADIEHNLSTLDEGKYKTKREKYALAKYILEMKEEI